MGATVTRSQIRELNPFQARPSKEVLSIEIRALVWLKTCPTFHRSLLTKNLYWQLTPDRAKITGGVEQLYPLRHAICPRFNGLTRCASLECRIDEIFSRHFCLTSSPFLFQTLRLQGQCIFLWPFKNSGPHAPYLRMM